jgi:hypothetical protein
MKGKYAMKKIMLSISLILVFGSLCFAQNYDFWLNEYWNWQFYTQQQEMLDLQRKQLELLRKQQQPQKQDLSIIRKGLNLSPKMSDEEIKKQFGLKGKNKIDLILEQIQWVNAQRAIEVTMEVLLYNDPEKEKWEKCQKEDLKCKEESIAAAATAASKISTTDSLPDNMKYLAFLLFQKFLNAQVNIIKEEKAQSKHEIPPTEENASFSNEQRQPIDLLEDQVKPVVNENILPLTEEKPNTDTTLKEKGGNKE